MIRKSKNPTSIALFGVAFFQGWIGLAGWTLYSVNNHFGVIDWLITFSGAFFFALAILARFQRILAALVASALYASYLGYQAFVNTHLLQEGFLLIKLPVIVLLLYAVVTSLRHPRSAIEEAESASSKAK